MASMVGYEFLFSQLLKELGPHRAATQNLWQKWHMGGVRSWRL